MHCFPPVMQQSQRRLLKPLSGLVPECQCTVSGIMCKNISQWQMYSELSLADSSAAFGFTELFR